MADDPSRAIATLHTEIERLRADVVARDAALDRRDRELTEALEQQTATAEVLRVIASSPTDIQPVLDAIVGSAMRLSDSTNAALQVRDGNSLRAVASFA